MPESRYDRNVSQGLRSGIDRYLTENDRAMAEKWGERAPRPPRIRVTDADKADLELSTIGALTKLQEATAKRLKGESLTMKERNAVQTEINKIIAGMLSTETTSLGGQNRGRITSAGNRETRYLDRGLEEVRSVSQLNPLEPKLQTEISGAAIHYATQDDSAFIMALVKNQAAIRENWPGVIAEISLDTGDSPEQVMANIERATMHANDQALQDSFRDYRRRSENAFDNADRAFMEAERAHDEGSRLIGMSGAGRSFIQDLRAQARGGTPEEISRALGVELSPGMPEDEIVSQARGIADGLIKRIEGMANDLTGEEIYDLLLRGGELEDFIKAQGLDPAGMSVGQKREILDATIHKGAKDARQKGMYTRTLAAFDAFSDMIPGGEEPDPADLLESLLYSTLHPAKIIREAIRRRPGFLFKKEGKEDAQWFKKKEGEEDAAEPRAVTRLEDERIDDTRPTPNLEVVGMEGLEGDHPYQDITKLQGKEERDAYVAGGRGLPQAPGEEAAPGAQPFLTPEGRTEQLRAGGATTVVPSPAGDDFGPYAEWEDGTVGFIHPETGQLVRVGSGERGFEAIAQDIFGYTPEELAGDPQAPAGQPGVQGADPGTVGGIVGNILGGRAGEEAPPPVEEDLGAPDPELAQYPDEQFREIAQNAEEPEELREKAALELKRRQALVDQMPDESGDAPEVEPPPMEASPLVDPLAGEDLSANDPQGLRGDSQVEGRNAARVEPGHWDRLRKEAASRKAALEAEVAAATMPEGSDEQLDALRFGNLDANDPQGAEGDAQAEALSQIEEDFPEGTEKQLQAFRAGPPKSLDEVLEAIGSSVEGLTLRQARRLLDKLTAEGAPEHIIQDLLSRWNEAYPQGQAAEEEVAAQESRPPIPETVEGEEPVDLMGGEPIRVVADPSSRDPFKDDWVGEEELEIDIDAPEEPIEEPPKAEPQEARGGAGAGEKKAAPKKEPAKEPEERPDYGGRPPRGNAPPQHMPGGSQYQAPVNAPEATQFEQNKMGIAVPHARPGAGIMAPPNISGAETPGNTGLGPNSKDLAAKKIAGLIAEQARKQMEANSNSQQSQPAQ